jgi:hypothetical protein
VERNQIKYFVSQNPNIIKNTLHELRCGVKKTAKNLSQDSWSPDQGLNPGSPEQKAGLLVSRSRFEPGTF